MKTLLILILIYAAIEGINFITKRYGFRGLIYSRAPQCGRCFEGEKLKLSVTVINKKIVPLPFLELVEKMPVDFEYEIPDNVQTTVEYNYHHSMMMLLPYQKVIRNYILKCGKRGRYYFFEVKMTIGDFFGLNTYTQKIENPVEIMVYPKIEDLDEILVCYRNPQGDVPVRRWIMEDPSMIMGIREYTSNDPFKSIHWASTARRGELMVKKLDCTSSQKAVILLNIETSRPFWMSIDSERIEKVIRIAASFAYEMIKCGIPTGFHTNSALSGLKYGDGNRIQPSCSGGHMEEILEILARAGYSPQCTFEELLGEVIENADRDCQYVIVTPIIAPEYLEKIDALDRMDCRVSVISLNLDNADMLPDDVAVFGVKEGGSKLEAV